MTAASTRDMLQARFAQNDLLRAASYAPMPESGDDLSGEHPTRPPDPSMIAGAAEALAQGQTHYVDVPGIAPLREALTGLLAASGVEAYAPGQLLVTAGVQEARFLSIQMIGRLDSFHASGCGGAAWTSHVNIADERPTTNDH